MNGVGYVRSWFISDCCSDYEMSTLLNQLSQLRQKIWCLQGSANLRQHQRPLTLGAPGSWRRFHRRSLRLGFPKIGQPLSHPSVNFSSAAVPDNVAAATCKPGSEDEYFYFDASSGINKDWKPRVLNIMLIYPSFISQEEESDIMKEIEPYMSRLHYESSHWDDAISDYRETERSKWNKKNTQTIDRIRAIAFPPNVPQLKLVHVLDLAQKGHIKPHIDSVRFCGNTIAGLSLLSDCVMRLRHDVQKEFYCDVFLPQYSLYVMSDFVRYEFTHEILGEAESKFKGRPVARKRRISIVCRNAPPLEDAATSGPVFVPIPSD